MLSLNTQISGTKRPLTLNLDMHHQVLQYYQVCSNDDPGLTLSYFMARSNLVPYMFLYGKKVKQWIFQKLLLSMIWNQQQMTEVTKSFCWHQNFVPSLPRGYICVLNHEKNCIKRFLWNLQPMGKVIRHFCWHQNFIPWRLSVPALGYIHVLNHEEKLYKIRLQRHFFETCYKWMKWQDISVDIKTLCPGGCLSLSWGYIHV